VAHRDALAALIESVTVTRPRAEWLATLERHDIPCGPINDYAQVFADAQVQARGLVVEMAHPALGHVRTLGTPLKLSETPLDPRRRAPLLGEHTFDVLRELGYDDEEISRLRR
jgi:crotonobetainyl-CoA:carnitine CoA-transferase CaiB-like acyl-CoA transferase